MNAWLVIGLAICGGLILTVIVLNIPIPECLESHEELVHHGAWTQFIPTGNGIIVPIFHPEYDSMETICDKYDGDGVR